MQLTRLQVGFGGIAVGGFFIISGFLITNSFLRSRSLWTYLKKRVARIYPGFIVCMIVCATIVVPLSHAHFTHQGVLRNVAGFLATTFALREFGYTGAFPSSHIHYINGSRWTVSNEFYCYLLVPVLGLAGALRKRVVLLGMFVMSTPWLKCFLYLRRLHTLAPGLDTSEIPSQATSNCSTCFWREWRFLFTAERFRTRDRLPWSRSACW